MRNSILGCILGGAIGDASMSAFEGVSPGRGPSWLDAPWQLSDGTQLTLATCEALAFGRVEPAMVAESMLRWFRSRRLRGLGSSTLKALRDLDAGCHWALAGCCGEWAAGNGAAMRVAPLAFCVDAGTSRGRQTVRDVCRITHHHEEAYVGALAVALAVQRSAASGEPPSLQDIAAELPDSVIRDRLQAIAKMEMSILEVAGTYCATGYVADSVPLALLASQMIVQIGLREVLDQLIQVGGDTDTVASIAGQVAGAALGFEALSDDLLERLPDREMILRIAHRFADGFATKQGLISG